MAERLVYRPTAMRLPRRGHHAATIVRPEFHVARLLCAQVAWATGTTLTQQNSSSANKACRGTFNVQRRTLVFVMFVGMPHNAATHLLNA